MFYSPRMADYLLQSSARDRVLVRNAPLPTAPQPQRTTLAPRRAPLPTAPALMLPTVSPTMAKPLVKKLNVVPLRKEDIQALIPTPPPFPIRAEKEQATPATCNKIQGMAKSYGISDVLSWAKNNCTFLVSFAPGKKCEEILDFIGTCKFDKTS